MIGREPQPTIQVVPHLLLRDPVEANGSAAAHVDELFAFQAFNAFPKEISVLSTEIGDVMSQLHFQMALPKGARRGQSQHLRQGGELLRRHLLQMHLILEDAGEPEDLLQRGVFFAFRELLLEGHQLFSFIGVLIRLIELLSPLRNHLLPEICHLLLCLQLSGQSGIVILLLKEGGWHHVGKEPQKEGQREFCKRHHQEEGEGNQLQAVTGGPDQQAPFAHGERVALEDPLRQEI
mmetsp:Transcript_9564/g.16487  ORF Transcript_9564/g.16487 Transcript_9564/m.16487 type:complete len:235 (+) Transcript_9564:816-1520(+)